MIKRKIPSLIEPINKEKKKEKEINLKKAVLIFFFK
jgi:hypothetical protein